MTTEVHGQDPARLSGRLWLAHSSTQCMSSPKKHLQCPRGSMYNHTRIEAQPEVSSPAISAD
eukprot:1384343-Amphidinium_carterae.1